MNKSKLRRIKEIVLEDITEPFLFKGTVDDWTQKGKDSAKRLKKAIDTNSLKDNLFQAAVVAEQSFKSIFKGIK